MPIMNYNLEYDINNAIIIYINKKDPIFKSYNIDYFALTSHTTTNFIPAFLLIKCTQSLTTADIL